MKIIIFDMASLHEENWKGKAQKADTHQNQKRHIPPVSLLLWHQMVPYTASFGL